MLFIPGNMAMPKHNTAGMGKLLAGHLHAIVGVAKDMHDADPTMSNGDLAFDGEFQRHFFLIDIALDGYDWGNSL